MKRAGRPKPTCEINGKKYRLNNKKLNLLVKEKKEGAKKGHALDEIVKGITALAGKPLFDERNLRSWIGNSVVTPELISEIINPMAEYFGVEVFELLVEVTEEESGDNDMTGMNNTVTSEKDTVITFYYKFASILSKVNTSNYYSFVPEYPDFYDADEWYALEVDTIISEVYKAGLLLSKENYEELLKISYEVEGFVKGRNICERWEELNPFLKEIYNVGVFTYKLDTYREDKKNPYRKRMKLIKYSDLINHYKKNMGTNMDSYSELVEAKELVARELIYTLSLRFREGFESMF